MRLEEKEGEREGGEEGGVTLQVLVLPSNLETVPARVEKQRIGYKARSSKLKV